MYITRLNPTTRDCCNWRDKAYTHDIKLRLYCGEHLIVMCNKRLKIKARCYANANQCYVLVNRRTSWTDSGGYKVWRLAKIKCTKPDVDQKSIASSSVIQCQRGFLHKTHKLKVNLRVHAHPSAIFRRWHHQYSLNSNPGVSLCRK